MNPYMLPFLGRPAASCCQPRSAGGAAHGGTALFVAALAELCRAATSAEVDRSEVEGVGTVKVPR